MTDRELPDHTDPCEQENSDTEDMALEIEALREELIATLGREPTRDELDAAIRAEAMNF